MQKQVAADINYQSFSKTFTVTTKVSSYTCTITTTVSVEKKAGFCLLNMTCEATGKSSSAVGTASRSLILGTLGEEFLPASLIRFSGWNSDYDLTAHNIFNITTSGEIKIDDTYGYALSCVNETRYALNVGYEAAEI